MSNGKSRVRLGALVILFFLAGINLPALLAGNNTIVLAETTTAPDLTVESISWSPELPAIGNTVTFTVAVRNQGDSPAAKSRLACFIDENLFNSAWIAGINPGATVMKTFTWKAQAGSHIIKAVIDYDNNVAEIDENNNDKTFAFSVLAPDLVVASIAWLPKNPSIGEKVTFTVTVKNEGDKTAAGSNVNLSIDGNSRGYREITRLEAGENTTATFTWPAMPGSHTIQAFADGWNQVKESDETNNNIAITYTTASPDLVIDSITWSPLSRSESSNVTMTVKISNRGSGKAKAFWLEYYVDDLLQTADFIEPLKAGGSTTGKYSWMAGSDSHTFKAVADSRSDVAENDETNNTMYVTLPTILPDLIVQSITQSPVSSIVVDTRIFYVIVKNQGLNLSGGCNLALYFNETDVLYHAVPMLVPGQTIMMSVNWLAETNSIIVKAVVDINEQINETNESNNTKTVKIGIPRPSPNTDMTIESIAWTPANPSIDDTIIVTASIKNKGPGQAGTSHVDYYMDDTFLDSVYVDQIGAGKTIVNFVTWQPTPGKHIIKVIADCDNNVAESNETNNEKTMTISVSAPDLLIQGVTWSPINPLTGVETSFTVTMKNQGDQIAGSTYINYYIDNSSRGRHHIEEIAPGATVTRTFTWRSQADSSVFRVVIDEANSVKESIESNNEKTVVLPAPDLTIDGITWSPINPSENATVTFNIVVKNQGAGQAPSPDMTVYINDTFLASIRFDQISPGETVAGACTWTTLNGEYTLKVVADEADIIGENNENNNIKLMTLSINQGLLEDTTQEITPPATPESLPPDVTTDNNTEIIKALLFEEVSDNQDIAADIADTSPAAQPWWQKILMNRLFIIGVGALGVGVLVALVLLRRRSRKK